MTLEQFDLSQAASNYAVANTPLFLVRKLREDSAVIEIAKRFSGDDILAALRRELQNDPVDLSDYVHPYVYLVALSMKETDSYLREATRISNTKKWDWFDYIALALLQTYTATNRESVTATSPSVNIGGTTIGSDIPVKYEKITA